MAFMWLLTGWQRIPAFNTKRMDLRNLPGEDHEFLNICLQNTDCALRFT